MGHAAVTHSWTWRLVWLMFLATMINYMDRQALLQTEKQVTEQFQLSNAEFGRLEKYFGITFACTQIFAGFACDRFSIRWIYAGALLIWSAAGFGTGLATTVTALALCRIVLAFGESFNWPCAVGVIRRTLPRESHSLANGIFHGGASIGGIVTPIIALAVMSWLGWSWQWVFFIIGGGGALWAIAWLAMTRGERAKVIDTPPPESAESAWHAIRSYFRLYRDRRIWLAVLVGVGINIAWHVPRYWLTKYFRLDLGFGDDAKQWLTAGYFIAADVGSLSAGWLTRRLIHGGRSVEAARKIVLMLTGTLCLIAIPAVLVNVPWLTVSLLLVFAAASMGGFANYFALCQDVDPAHTSLVLGTSGFAAWFTVGVLQEYAGAYADAAGQYGPILMAASVAPLVGGLIGLWWPAEQGKAHGIP